MGAEPSASIGDWVLADVPSILGLRGPLVGVGLVHQDVVVPDPVVDVHLMPPERVSVVSGDVLNVIEVCALAGGRQGKAPLPHRDQVLPELRTRILLVRVCDEWVILMEKPASKLLGALGGLVELHSVLKGLCIFQNIALHFQKKLICICVWDVYFAHG